MFHRNQVSRKNSEIHVDTVDEIQEANTIGEIDSVPREVVSNDDPTQFYFCSMCDIFFLSCCRIRLK